MNRTNNLKEIEDSLPNGFHDAFIEAVTIGFASKSAKIDLQLFILNPAIEPSRRNGEPDNEGDERHKGRSSDSPRG